MKRHDANPHAIYSKVKLIEEFENIKPLNLDGPIVSIALVVIFILMVLFLPEISGKEAVYFFTLVTSILLAVSHVRNKQLHKKVDLLFEIVNEEAQLAIK